MQHLQKQGGQSRAIVRLRFIRPYLPSPYALPSSVSHNPFVCPSCENCRVCTDNSHSETRTRHSSVVTRNSTRWEYPVGSHMNRVYLDFNATTPIEPAV